MVPAEVLRKTAEARGLPLRSTPRVLLLDDGDFTRELRQMVQPSGATEASEGGRWEKAAREAAEERWLVAKHETVGLYDEAGSRILLRKEADAPDNPLEWVLAHEVGHALQAQNFRLFEPHQIPTADGRLAYQALLEGDATLAMLAYLALDNWVPMRRAVAITIRDVLAGDLSSMEAWAGDEVLAKADPGLREEFVFPYASGTFFLAQLHRAGGFPLVNRVFQHPPYTTEHVLHVEKYLAGEPVQWPGLPALPPGYREVARSSFGELQTRALLMDCVSERGAIIAAEGWGGDMYSLAEGGHGQLLLWNTVWDTEADAQQFHRAMAKCGTAEEARQLLAYRGKRVSFAAGGTAQLLSWYHSQMLATPITAAEPTAPFGKVALVPVPPEAPAEHPIIRGRVFSSRHLGVQLPIPEGYTAKIDGTDLVAEAPGDRAGLLILTYSPLLVSSGSMGTLFSSLRHEIEQRLDGPRMRIESNGVSETALGRASERAWRIEGTPARVSARAVPICSNTGSIVLTTFVTDPAEARIIEAAVARASWMSRDLPVCGELNP